MPKIVNHDERRAQIVSAAWKLIAEEGLDAVTTRRIAERTGYSNGSLRYYFPGKDAVVTAAFQHIFDATNLRARAGDATPRGLAGLRLLAMEIMPLDAERLDEARVAIAFMNEALHDAAKSSLYTDLMNEWRAEFTHRLEEARIDGEVSAEIDTLPTVDELLSMLMGLQILAALSPTEADVDRQTTQLDAFILNVSRGSTNRAR
jgi:AcrR family transcriptional regulator